jgi:hypothetical protein
MRPSLRLPTRRFIVLAAPALLTLPAQAQLPRVVGPARQHLLRGQWAALSRP